MGVQNDFYMISKNGQVDGLLRGGGGGVVKMCVCKQL